MEQDSKGQAKGALMKSLDNALTLLEQFTPEASAWVGRVFAESGLPGRKIAADRKNIFYTVPAAEVQRWQAASEGVGARQATCRLIYAASGCITFSKWALMTQSRSGLSVTAPMGSQLRVLPDHRAGFDSRACRYSVCRAARMARSSPA